MEHLLESLQWLCITAIAYICSKAFQHLRRLMVIVDGRIDALERENRP